MEGKTIHQLAHEARVSPTAIVNIRKGKFGPQSEEQKKKKGPPNERQLKGWVTTLTRLTWYANQRLATKGKALDYSTVMTEVGLDASRTIIQNTITEVRGQGGVHRIEADPVLRQIALRNNRVKVGILHWPPFFPENEEQASTSWAWEYTKSLLGLINPVEWTLEAEKVDDIEEVVDELGSGSRDYDLIFGLYDTPYRQLRGLTFIHLPGLGVPLARVQSKDLKDLDWSLIQNVHSERRPSMRALVLEREVGHLFLAGAAQFGEANLLIDRSFNLNSLIPRYIAACKKPGALSFLCADRTFCRRFLDASERYEATNKKEFDLLSNLEISKTDHLTPSYRVGFTIRADAPVWSRLLYNCQADELFRNAHYQIALIYARLFNDAAKNASSYEMLDFVLHPFPAHIPKHLVAIFATECYRALTRQAQEIFKDPIHKNWIKEALAETAILD